MEAARERKKLEIEAEYRKLAADRERKRLEAEAEERKLSADKQRLEMEKVRKQLEIEAELKLEKERKQLELDLAKQKLQLDLDKRQHETLLNVEEKKKLAEVESNQPPKFDLTKCLKLVPEFNEKDVDSFFRNFEDIASSLNWPLDQWVWLVKSRFQGKAAVVVSHMVGEKEYEVIKQAILDAYMITTEGYRQKFRNYLKNQTQTWYEFANEKLRLFNKWIKAADVDNFEKLINLIVTEEFMRKLPHSIKLHIADKEESDLKKAALLADSYSLIHRSFRGPERDVKEGKVTNDGSDEENVKYCSYCKNSGHDINECKYPSCKKSKFFGSPGRSDSKMKSGKVPPKDKSTLHCSTRNTDGLFEQYISEGTVALPGGKPTKVNILRDTGSSQSMILSSVMPKVKKLNEKVRVHDLRHSTIMPLVTLMLNCKYVQGPVKLAVMNKPFPVKNVQVLLGNDLAGHLFLPTLAIDRSVTITKEASFIADVKGTTSEENKVIPVKPLVNHEVNGCSPSGVCPSLPISPASGAECNVQDLRGSTHSFTDPFFSAPETSFPCNSPLSNICNSFDDQKSSNCNTVQDHSVKHSPALLCHPPSTVTIDYQILNVTIKSQSVPLVFNKLNKKYSFTSLITFPFLKDSRVLSKELIRADTSMHNLSWADLDKGEPMSNLSIYLQPLSSKSRSDVQSPKSDMLYQGIGVDPPQKCSIDSRDAVAVIPGPSTLQPVLWPSSSPPVLLRHNSSINRAEENSTPVAIPSTHQDSTIKLKSPASHRSSKLMTSQVDYSSCEVRLLCIFPTFENRVYRSTHIFAIVCSDDVPVLFLDVTKDLLLRWSLFLQDYNIKWQRRRCSDNTITDVYLQPMGSLFSGEECDEPTSGIHLCP